MGFFDRFRRRQAPEQPDEAAASTPAAAVIADALTGTLRDLPTSRESVDESTLDGVLTLMEDTLAGYPSDTRSRIIRVFRMLAQSDDDVGGTLRDLQALANTRFSFEIDAGPRATRQAQRELDAWNERVYRGGLKALGDNQTREAYLAGASSIEWVPTPSRTGIQRAEVVDPATIRIHRDPDTDEWRHYQTGPAADPIELNPITYQYVPVDTDANSPYGVPAMITAMRTLARKSDLLKGENRLIAAAAKVALITASIQPPDPRKLGVASDTDPAYLTKLREYTQQVAKRLAAGSENGLYVAPNTVEMQATGVRQNMTGTGEITDRNQRLLWSGLGSQPFLRGDMSANYALAKVIYPTMLSFAENIRATFRANLEYGANLHLRLAGIPATVKIVYEDPPNPFRGEDATATLDEARTDELMLRLAGDAWLPRMAAKWDLDEEAVRQAREPGEPDGPEAPPSGATDSGEEGGAQDE